MNITRQADVLLDEQLKLVFRALPVSLIGTSLALLILAQVIHEVVPADNLMLWLAGSGVVILLRGLLYLAYHRTEQPDPVFWSRLFILGAFLAGCSWGSVSIWLYPIDSLPHQILIAFAIAGVIAAGAVSLAAMWQSFLFFMPPVLLPLIYKLWQMPDSINLAMLLVSGIFMLVMINNVRNSYQTTRQNISLRQKSINSEKAMLKSQYDLEESRQMLSWIIDTIPVSVYWKNNLGRYLGCNKLFADQLGLLPDEIIGLSDTELPDHGRQKLCQCNEQEVVESGQPVLNREQCISRVNGQSSWINCSLIPLTNPHGDNIGVLGASHDITGHKRIDQIKNEFVATVSHELRTPLTSIRGAIGLLHDGYIRPDEEKFNELIGIAHNNTDRLLHLIEDLLTIQKIESADVDFQMQTVQLDILLQQTVADNQSLTEQYQVSFNIEQTDPNAIIMGDPHRLTQVITNLLSNAAKFSKPGQDIELGIYRDDDLCYLYVQDHGIGIPKAFYNKLFDRFTQWDASNSRQVGGTGLGLNIVKSIVERHQGKIYFESKEGEGTRFEICLPACVKIDVTESSIE
ncbi:MAG: ATP-binding protein [Gammaproteobacteria bacterium]|nr:ATP-binding protein [Gammaproteobacteria bacterium]